MDGLEVKKKRLTLIAQMTADRSGQKLKLGKSLALSGKTRSYPFESALIRAKNVSA
jgi:hypothetical protein